MKRYGLLLFILCLSTMLSGQSYIDIDFSAEVNCGYAEGVLNIPPDIGWGIDIDNLSEGKGIAKVNRQEAFEIYGIEGSFSLELGMLKVDRGKPYLVSFDLSNLSLAQDKTEHLEYVGILYESEKCLYSISKKVANTSIKIESSMEDSNMMFSVVFDNITENGHYAVDNIKIHRFIAPCDKTIPDTTSLISSNCQKINTRFIDDYKKQRIFSFNIEDVDYGSDELSTIITDIRIENQYENQVRLGDLLSNLSVYCNGEIIDNCESRVVDNTIFLDFKGTGLEINSNSRNTIDVYADINDSVELISGVMFALKLTSDMCKVSIKGSQLISEQEVLSSNMEVMPSDRGDGVFYDDYSTDKSRQYSYIDNWIRVESDDKIISSDSLLQTNALSCRFNYLSVNQDNLLFNRQDISWSIDISNGDWNPSRTNKFCFFLMSDKSELYGSVSGYAVGVDMDGHDDILCLYRVDSGTFVRIAETSFVWEENERVNLRVVRLRTGDWLVSFNDDSSSSKYNGTIKYHDNTYRQGNFSGVLFRYTLSRADKLWIDNYNISILKDEGLYIEKFYLDKDENLCLVFSDDVNTKDILIVKNYSLSINNVNVEIDNVSLDGNHVVIKADLRSGKYDLIVDNIHNHRGELLHAENVCFEYVYTAQKGDIIINELMLDPLEGSFEYIELYNTKDVDIEVSDVTYSYKGETKDTIDRVSMPAHSYLLLSSSKGYASVSKHGQTHAIKSFVLNNESASICLRNRYGVKLDSISYSDEWYDSSMPTKGVSLERISESDPNDGTNWTSSKSETGGTPGKVNQTKGDDIKKESAVLLSVDIISPTSVRLVFDKDIDKESLNERRFFSFSPADLLKVKDMELEDSRKVKVTFNNDMPEGEHCSIEVYGLLDVDGLKIDSSMDFDVPCTLKSGDIIINELMLDPLEGSFEYIELYNTKDVDVEVSDVTYSYKGETKDTIDGVSMPAHGYLLLSSSKGYASVSKHGQTHAIKSFVLNNESASICLKNRYAVVLDSISYSDEWYDSSKPTKGVSLERISESGPNDGTNWTSSKSETGGTPGEVNQTKGDDIKKESAVLLSVDIISPTSVRLVFDKDIDKESLNERRFFSFSPADLLKVKDMELEDSRKVKVTFNNDMPGGEHCSVEVFGLLDVDGLKIDSSMSFDVPCTLKSGDIIINEVLLKPYSGGVSFVEIYNNSNRAIYLSSLKISFSIGEYLPVSLEPISLDAKSYFVLSRDKSGVINYYDSVNETLFADVDEFPAIIESNSVSILDYRNVVIDKLLLDDYFYANSLKEGVSLERVSFYIETEERENWKTPTTVTATPTFANSVLDNGELLEIKISNQTFRPFSGRDDNKYIVDIKNHGDSVWLNMYIYNIDAQKIKEVASNLEVTESVTLKWDGSDERGRIVSTASYMVILEIIHADGTKELKRFVCILCN